MIRLDEPISEIMDLFGYEFVSYVSNNGYDRILRIMYVRIFLLFTNEHMNYILVDII